MFSFFHVNVAVTKTLKSYIERKLLSLDNPAYAFTVINKIKPSELMIISSYPSEWVSFYRDNNFQYTDPVILSAFKRTSPFIWDENISLISDLNLTKIFSLSKKYNIVNGYSFVLHDQMNNLSLLSFIIDSSDRVSLEKQLEEKQAALQMLLIDFNQQMYKLAETNISFSGGTTTAEGSALFTCRENEVLYWASMGKTYAETAAITGISQSTVKFHIKNVVTKLGVSNARQAIRLGVELGLIRPTALKAG